MKSYTDLEQSLKLAEILPLESADMCYLKREINNTFIETPIIKPIGGVEKSLCCWSLAALLSVLNKSAYFANEAGIVELSSIKATRWCVSILNCRKIENCYADEPIDACVAMIEKLHKLKLL